MSLAIVFKGSEGIVLAVDSRVTLTMAVHDQAGINTIVPATFDNATKLLQVKGCRYIGAVTYGVGAIGQRSPRTAHSFMPEFEEELKGKTLICSTEEDSIKQERRMSVEEFARELGQFFLKQWQKYDMPASPGPAQVMVFYVAGYNEGEPYGKVYELHVPTAPEPKEWHGDEFGVVWGGQREFVDRLITGYDPQTLEYIKQEFKLDDAKIEALHKQMQSRIQTRIPYQFLPLQDCVNLAILLIRATMTIQTFTVGIRGVGGAIDVGTITRTDGLKIIQSKSIMGEVP